jgi:uncharacterized membrane protein
MIVGHNALDGLTANEFGRCAWLWTLLHGQGEFSFAGMSFGTAYKIVPWVGVMMAGYGFGHVLLWERDRRRRFIVGLGLAMIAAFVVLRSINVYGDRNPRITAPDPHRMAELAAYRAKYPMTENPPLSGAEFAALSFLNCEKYPPSLDYLLMTLGPALLLLAAMDRPPGPLGRVFVIFGRVPLFYYLLHIALIVPALYLVVIAGQLVGLYGSAAELAQAGGLKLPLWAVYLIWIAVVVVLYFPCRWYADLKRRSGNPLLSYL